MTVITVSGASRELDIGNPVTYCDSRLLNAIRSFGFNLVQTGEIYICLTVQ